MFYLGMIRLGMAGWPPAPLPGSGWRVALAGLLLSGLGLLTALALPYPPVSRRMTNPWAHRRAQEVISYTCLPVGEAGSSSVVLTLGSWGGHLTTSEASALSEGGVEDD